MPSEAFMDRHLTVRKPVRTADGPAQFDVNALLRSELRLQGSSDSQSLRGWRGILTMKDAEGRKFYHRVNTDGTIDSICLRCFLTAAKAEIGSELREIEAAHQCDDKELFIVTETLQGSRRS